MRRTSILLDPGLLAELERLARRQGRPTAHIIREALDRYVSEQAEQRRELPEFVGMGRGVIGSTPGEGEPAATGEAPAGGIEPSG